MPDTTSATIEKRVYSEGNSQSVRATLRQIVDDPQFKSGYCDRLADMSPRAFYFDDRAGNAGDAWGYERGRLVATWLLTTGQALPAVSDIGGLVMAYWEADSAGVVL